ncbi:DUF5966 family protein [Streptococcus cuniculi]
MKFLRFTSFYGTLPLAANGIWSFTTFYIAFNDLPILGLVTKIARSR